MTGYKINSNKSVAFLYTSDKSAKKEIRETIPFSIATNNIKFLGVTLSKQVKDLYNINFKFLKKEIKEISEDINISSANGSIRLTFSKKKKKTLSFSDTLVTMLSSSLLFSQARQECQALQGPLSASCYPAPLFFREMP